MVSDPEENQEQPEQAEAAKPKRWGRFTSRRRSCPICAEGMQVIDYKDINFLRRFISDRGRIQTRRKVATCAKHQRALAQAIKRARHIALLPYTVDHIRKMGIPSR